MFNPFSLDSMSVLDFLDLHFESIQVKCSEYRKGTILHTANSRRWTNAIIVADAIDGVFVVLTDIGNFVEFTQAELEATYLPPVCRRTLLDEDSDDYYTPE